jgi:hypothetical protein
MPFPDWLIEAALECPPKDKEALEILLRKTAVCKRCSEVKIVKAEPRYDPTKGHTCFDGYMTCPVKTPIS